MQDHYRRSIDLRHAGNEMTDRHFIGHGHDLLCCHAKSNVVERIHICWSVLYASGMTPGALSGHFAMVASSIFRCWATNAGGV